MDPFASLQFVEPSHAPTSAVMIDPSKSELEIQRKHFVVRCLRTLALERSEPVSYAMSVFGIEM